MIVLLAEKNSDLFSSMLRRNLNDFILKVIQINDYFARDTIVDTLRSTESVAMCYDMATEWLRIDVATNADEIVADSLLLKRINLLKYLC